MSTGNSASINNSLGNILFTVQTAWRLCSGLGYINDTSTPDRWSKAGLWQTGGITQTHELSTPISTLLSPCKAKSSLGL